VKLSQSYKWSAICRLGNLKRDRPRPNMEELEAEIEYNVKKGNHEKGKRAKEGMEDTS
jgi:hypothetical protein